jgi:hypothetical protein
MTEHTDFIESRMLHAYLDGELNGAHEEALFRMLSEDSALRSEMQDHLAIRKAIQHDTQAYSPPPAATAAVFGALGFSVPSIAHAASGAGRIWFASGSAFLAVTTALLLSLLFTTEDAALLSAEPLERPPIELRIEALPAMPDLPVGSVSRAAALPAAAIIPEQESPIEEALPAVIDEAPERMLLQPPAEFATTERPDLRGIRAPFIPYVSLLRIPKDGAMLYVRNASLQSMPDRAVASATDFPLSDVNVGVLLPLGKHHALGVEFGRETFPQEFSTMVRGASVRYEQTPTAYCATAVYQLTAGDIFPWLTPYAQFQAGLAYRIGPLGRVHAGLAIKPIERISLLVGAEGSILGYKFQNTWFDTRKFGLTYGIRYDF